MGRGGQRGKMEDICNTVTIKRYFTYQKKLKYDRLIYMYINHITQ